jgi:murein DD-endopeptidase MepM/ murein hydrolase activator NlpD
LEQLSVRSYAAGILLVGLVTFTGSLRYSLARVGRPAGVEAKAPASGVTDAAVASKGATPAGTSGAASPDPGPAAARPAGTGAGTGATHTVKPGETLFAIARLYGSNVEAMKQANGLTSDRIWAGQVLKVPDAKAPRRHIVQQGESLWELASRYGVTLEALLASNPDLGNPGHLQIGQAVVLPSGAAAGDVVAATIGPIPALDGVFAWPVLAPISSLFGPRDGRNHNGLDLAANMGDPIKAARDGEVLLAGTVDGYGETVILRHEDGTRTLYGHASRLLVKAGERVRQGEVIAEVGSTGRSTGPHLHFEIIVNSKPLDPLLYLPKSARR